MIDISVNYLGKQLKNPIIIGSSELTSNMDSLLLLEEAGASAVVIKSLFEEQIHLKTMQIQKELDTLNYRSFEMINIFPDFSDQDVAEEHFFWTKKAKQELKIPVFASLNCINKETWIEYAKKMEDIGVDGLELNFYALPGTFNKTAQDIETEQLHIIESVRKAINIPIAIKLSPFYTAPLNFISRIDNLGVDALVLFNRLFYPDIDIDKEDNIFPIDYSSKNENKLPLKFVALLSDHINASICASTGIEDWKDVVKMLLAGAECVQIVSTVYKNSNQYIKDIITGLTKWMVEKSYKSIKDFKGKLSAKNNADSTLYQRSQYINILMRKNPFANIL